MWSAMWRCCKHTFHSQEVLVIHLQSCKTLGKVFCTQLPECKMFTMVQSIGGNDSSACSLSMLGFRDVGFESFCISANELTMLSKSGNNLVSLPEKMHWQVVSDPAVSFSRGMVNYQDPNMNVECPLCIWRCWELASCWTYRELYVLYYTHYTLRTIRVLILRKPGKFETCEP